MGSVSRWGFIECVVLPHDTFSLGSSFLYRRGTAKSQSLPMGKTGRHLPSGPSSVFLHCTQTGQSTLTTPWSALLCDVRAGMSAERAESECWVGSPSEHKVSGLLMQRPSCLSRVLLTPTPTPSVPLSPFPSIFFFLRQ